jgi:hypothetical protein
MKARGRTNDHAEVITVRAMDDSAGENVQRMPVWLGPSNPPPPSTGSAVASAQRPMQIGRIEHGGD